MCRRGAKKKIGILALLLFLLGSWIHMEYDMFRFLQYAHLVDNNTPISPSSSSQSVLLELEQLAKSQVEPWYGFQMNKSDVKDYAQQKTYLYVVEIINGTMHTPEYIDKELDLNSNVRPLLAVIEQILRQGNHSIRDTVLFLNLLDEPRNPNKTRCQQTGVYDQIEKYHGLPLSSLDHSVPWFPILSPAIIPNCFQDILVPFGDILEPDRLTAMRTSSTNQPPCEWSNAASKKRLSTAIFRGSLTGHSVKEGRNHRMRLVQSCDNESSRYIRKLLANLSSSSGQNTLDKFSFFSNDSIGLDNPPLCDAAFSQSLENIREDIASSSYFLPMSMWQQVTWLVLDIDGNSYSRRLANLCFADVNIIRLGIFQDVLLMLLNNATHYRHIQLDQSDLFSTLQYFRDHFDESQQLCRNKQQRCRQVLCYEHMKYYVQVLLEEYSQQVVFL